MKDTPQPTQLFDAETGKNIAAMALGSLGGSKRSEAKREAAKINGLKGGWHKNFKKHKKRKNANKHKAKPLYQKSIVKSVDNPKRLG